MSASSQKIKKNRRWILRSEDIRARCAEQVSLLAIDSERPLEVVAREHKTNRSLEQNAQMWRIITLFADYQGQGKTRAYYDLLCEYTGLEERETITGKKIISPLKTSSEMSVKEMSDFIEWLFAFAIEYGIAA